MNGTTPSLPSGAWLVVGLLWVVACLNYLDRVMLTTMRHSIVEAIPMTDSQFGLLTSVFLWVYAGLSPLAGFLADRFSRSRVIVISLLAWSAVTWLTAHAKTFDQLLVARALMGISEAAYIPAALSLLADYHRGTTRSLAIGIHHTGVAAGAGLGGLGGWIAQEHGWTHPFNVFGLVGLVYSGLLIFLLRDAAAHTTEESSSPETEKTNLGQALTSLLSCGAFYLLLIYWGLYAVASWAFVGWLPTYLMEHFQMSQGAGGMSATGYLQAASIVGMLVGGAVTDRWSRTNPRARFLVPMIGMFIAALGIQLVAITPVLVLAIVGLMIFGLARTFADVNTMPMLCALTDPRYRATGYGIMNLVAMGVGGLTIYAGGVLRDAHVNISLVFQVGAACYLLASVLLHFAKPPVAAPITPLPVTAT